MSTCGDCIYPVFYSRVNGCLVGDSKKLISPQTKCHCGKFKSKRKPSELKKYLNVFHAKEALNASTDD